MYIHTYIYIHKHRHIHNINIHIHIYIYIYTDRTADEDRQGSPFEQSLLKYYIQHIFIYTYI
jgi:hypothetical protein